MERLKLESSTDSSILARVDIGMVAVGFTILLSLEQVVEQSDGKDLLQCAVPGLITGHNGRADPFTQETSGTEQSDELGAGIGMAL